MHSSLVTPSDLYRPRRTPSQAESNVRAKVEKDERMKMMITELAKTKSKLAYTTNDIERYKLMVDFLMEMEVLITRIFARQIHVQVEIMMTIHRAESAQEV